MILELTNIISILFNFFDTISNIPLIFENIKYLTNDFKYFYFELFDIFYNIKILFNTYFYIII